jgi:hypothetical protein
LYQLLLLQELGGESNDADALKKATPPTVSTLLTPRVRRFSGVSNGVQRGYHADRVACCRSKSALKFCGAVGPVAMLAELV